MRSTETETDLHACADVADRGTGETENGAAAAGEIDLRENPGASTDGPMAPVFEEWYHGKIARKEVTWTRFKKACVNGLLDLILKEWNIFEGKKR